VFTCKKQYNNCDKLLKFAFQNILKYLITIIDLGSEVMKKENKNIVLDVILVAISLYLALLLKFDFRIQPDYREFFILSIVPVVALTIIFNMIFKLYSNIWKYASVEELLSIVYSMTASNIDFLDFQ